MKERVTDEQVRTAALAVARACGYEAARVHAGGSGAWWYVTLQASAGGASEADWTFRVAPTKRETLVALQHMRYALTVLPRHTS